MPTAALQQTAAVLEQPLITVDNHTYEELRDFFDDIKTEGSFATSERILGDIAIGLTVDGVRRLIFPLTKYQVKKIAEICHKILFGKGSDAIVDESVRKT